MEDKYTGDIGDYCKYGLLRALSPGYKLGVAWYLYPDEGHNVDGSKISYLSEPDNWRKFDPKLFDALEGIVSTGDRRVTSIENSSVLEGASYFTELLNPLHAAVGPPRGRWRKSWFSNLISTLDHCDLIFADPDNGFCASDRFSHSKVKDWKRLPLDEAYQISKGRSALFYHHNTRFPGGHKKEIDYWCDQFDGEVLALYWRAHGNRTFFLVNATSEMRERMFTFAGKWGPKAELYINGVKV